MPLLSNYRQFDGLHWETGTVRNYLAHIGVKAPHTGQPYSEAFLLGVSGGAAMGYFSFAYEGYDPMARVLTRNTFDPWMTMLSRLGVVQNVRQTTSPEKGVAHLVTALEEGTPAIVWADLWSLPYNALAHDDGMWAMFPILVYGYDEAAGTVTIADRARVALSVTPAELAAARGRVKKDRYRLITLEAPNPDNLAAAVSAGIWDCIKLYSEKPPKGTRDNFGLAAYRWWAELLTKPKARLSWDRVFPRGRALLAGLTSAYGDILTFGKDTPAERDVYARFLDEAAAILGRPGLGEAAALFRQSGQAWQQLTGIMLPATDALLGEVGELLRRRHTLFLDTGNAAVPEMQAIDARLGELRAQAAADFPLSPDEVAALQQRMAEQLLAIGQIEEEAIHVLRAVMTAA